MDAGVFKAYDIRGIHGRDLAPADAEQIGRAFARVIAANEAKSTSELRLGLGRDMRLTAPEMAAGYRAGMIAEGATVLDAGQVGTEMLYFLVGSRDLDGGIMCTASHNPKAYTGAKLVGRGALALSGETGIGDIRDLVLGDELGPVADTPGHAEDVDVYDDFHAAALAFIDPAKINSRLKIVVDGGNGMAGPMVGPLLTQLGLDLVECYWTPDGNFPDHEPNPLLPENRQFIIDEVKAQGADLGIAWDGDSDRCFFFDSHGDFVDGDFLTALLAKALLAKNPGETILYDIRASRAVPDMVAAAGGTALVNRVGHAFFKRRMREEGGIFGGEVSGHYYFRDFYCADSGTLPALLVLELLSESGETLAEMVGGLRAKYFISGEINSEVTDPKAKITEITARFADAEQRELDGISIDYPDWHFNVRMSNTEPLLRLCLESLVSQADMEAKRDEVLALIRA
jgi:phosphomannomutase